MLLWVAGRINRQLLEEFQSVYLIWMEEEEDEEKIVVYVVRNVGCVNPVYTFNGG